MSEIARWVDATIETKAGDVFFCNFSSWEIFTVPDCRATHGTLAASMPFRLFDRSLVKDLVVEFRAGEVVELAASEGREAFSSWLRKDVCSGFLGEIALVGHESPAHGTEMYFDSPHLDENVASHVAFGKGIFWALDGSEVMTDRELQSHGCNDSITHTDVMFGAPGVSVTATRTTEGEVPLLEGGRWVGGR